MLSMHNKSSLGEVLVIILLLAILILSINPSGLLMPMSMSMMVLVGFIVLFFVFAGLIWKESVHDERESLHRSEAGRWSFFVGLTMLAVGIVVESFSHSIDPWLVYALIGMIGSKLVSRMYHQRKN